MNRFVSTLRSTLPALIALSLVDQASASDWIIPAGQTVTYDTGATPTGNVYVTNLIVETGATLRIVGGNRFHLNATRQIRVDGVLDVSGATKIFGVATLDTTSVHEPGAHGGAAGGAGGTGNPVIGASVAKGDDGSGSFGIANAGGQGGESGYNASQNDENRRPGGGGGGALAPNQPVHANPLHISNLGLIARPGGDGAATAFGALTGALVPHGGLPASLPFQDGDLRNDFFGRKLSPLTGLVIVGELPSPLAGRGGGAGGNAIQSAVFPAPVWTPTGDEKGAGGGGGGGLTILEALHIELGPQGRISVNGGNGAGGENSFQGGITRIGGGSGGGSGGHLILQARVIDLSAAQPNALIALGGRGGQGKNNQYYAECSGGDGGPGIIQIHTFDGAASVLLEPGVALASLTSPDAHLLLPAVSFTLLY